MGGKSKHRITEASPSLLAEKNQQIAVLEQEVEAYRAKASHIQTRLLSTLDALDALQLSHTHEVAALNRTKNNLNDKLDRYIDIVAAAEDERNDLRDAVLQLVEKVEVSNDYSVWPYSRIRISHPADHPPNKLANPQHPSDEQLFAYASAMIATLRLERDAERKAHAATREDSEWRISTLQAELARREAELETCLFHHTRQGTVSPLHNQGSPGTPTQGPTVRNLGDRTGSAVMQPRMSQDETIAVLEMASAKNRALEMEVKVLAERLEQVRPGSSRAPVDARADTEEPLREQAPVTTVKASYSSTVPANHRAEVPEPSSQARAHDAAPPARLARSPMPRTDRRNPSPCSSGPMVHSPERLLSPILDDVLLPQRNGSPRHSNRLHDLDEQIQDLVRAMDALRVERELVARSLNADRDRDTLSAAYQDGYSDSSDHEEMESSPLLTIEEECVRLAQSEKTLRAALRAAKAQEGMLRDQIARLTSTTPIHHIRLRDQRSRSPGSGARSCSPADSSLWDQASNTHPREPPSDSGGERSMDLATPLSAAADLTCTPSSAVFSPYVDPPSIPLPPSPDEDERSGDDPSEKDDHDDTRILRIEEQLASAHAELEDRGRAMAELQDIVAELQQQLQLRRPRPTIEAGTDTSMHSDLFGGAAGDIGDDQ